MYSETKVSEIFLDKTNPKITEWSHAVKGYASSYNVEIITSFNLKLKHRHTESIIKNKLIDLLTKLKRFKFLTILFLLFKKIESDEKTKYSNFYWNSKEDTIINESDIDDVFESIYTTIISNIQKSLGKFQVGLLIQT